MAKKKKNPYNPTVEERRRAINHLFYEIEQLIDTSSFSVESIVVRDAKEKGIVKNAILESVLIHTRILRDFYSNETRSSYRGAEKDDVLVSDYGFRPRIVNIPSDVRNRLNKDLAHLTYDRSKRRTQEEKWWDYSPMVVPIMERSKEFVEHLQSNCLDLLALKDIPAAVEDCERVLRKIEGYLNRHSR